MRRAAILAAGIATAVLALAGPALGQHIDGGCTVTATASPNGDIMGTPAEATRSNPFEIDPDGTISYIATSLGAIMDHTWRIRVDIAGFKITVASGGDPNEGGTVESIGTVDVRREIEEIKQENPSLPEIRGIYLVSGDIRGDGGTCTGSAYVRVLGSPLDSIVGQVAAVIGLIALAGFIFAGVARSR